VIQLAVGKHGEVKLLRDKRLRDMARQPGMPANGREIACPASFIGHAVTIVDSKAEAGIMIPEEGGDVIVVDNHGSIWLCAQDPGAQWFVGGKNRLPIRIVLLLLSSANSIVGVWEVAIAPMILAM